MQPEMILISIIFGALGGLVGSAVSLFITWLMEKGHE